MPGPIKPNSVQTAKSASIPEEVYTVFNDLIVENWDGRQAKVLQTDAATRVARALDIPRDKVFERRLLDVEAAYQKEGWVVSFDKPAYNESYEAFFVFKKRVTRGR